MGIKKNRIKQNKNSSGTVQHGSGRGGFHVRVRHNQWMMMVMMMVMDQPAGQLVCHLMISRAHTYSQGC
jgi:hypothetical protein